MKNLSNVLMRRGNTFEGSHLEYWLRGGSRRSHNGEHGAILARAIRADKSKCNLAVVRNSVAWFGRRRCRRTLDPFGFGSGSEDFCAVVVELILRQSKIKKEELGSGQSVNLLVWLRRRTQGRPPSGLIRFLPAFQKLGRARRRTRPPIGPRLRLPDNSQSDLHTSFPCP